MFLKFRAGLVLRVQPSRPRTSYTSVSRSHLRAYFGQLSANSCWTYISFLARGVSEAGTSGVGSGGSL